MFPAFTGHGPCPKCGKALLTYWHEVGFSLWEVPLGEARPCHEVLGWPQVDGGALDPSDKTEEEHLHRLCEGCGYQAIEALVVPGQHTPISNRYDLVWGLQKINERAALGWVVVAGLMPGTDIVALMKAPDQPCGG